MRRKLFYFDTKFIKGKYERKKACEAMKRGIRNFLSNTEMYEVAFKDTGFKEEEYFEMQDSLGGVAGVADLIAEKDSLEAAEMSLLLHLVEQFQL